jgi:FHS family L-fucose permease-like MFS transporter
MAIISSRNPANQAPVTRTNPGAMAMVTTLFFMWAFLTELNDILIPHLQSIFDLNYTQSMMVQLVFFTGYAVFALPSGKLVEWAGYKRTMVLGLVTMALGSLFMLPAANAASFPLFLGAELVLAAGITALQVAANPYVSILGPPQGASSRLNLTQAFNSLGATIAPYFGSLVILSAAPLSMETLRGLSPQVRSAYQMHEAATVKVPYVGIAVALLLLATVIGFFKLPEIAPEEDLLAVKDSNATGLARLLQHRQLVFGVIAIFVYVGAEVSIGSFLVKYFHQPEIANMSDQSAGKLVTIYWGSMMVGRFIGAWLLQKVKPGQLLAIVASGALALVAISMLTTGHLAVGSILLVGLFNSIMFPTIFTLAIVGLGPLTGEGSGLLIMAIVGGAAIPVLQGMIADKVGIHHAFVLPLICYLYIAYYGLIGSKVRHSREQSPA